MKCIHSRQEGGSGYEDGEKGPAGEQRRAAAGCEMLRASGCHARATCDLEQPTSGT